MEKLKSVLEKLAKVYFLSIPIPAIFSILMLIIQFSTKKPFLILSSFSIVITYLIYFFINLFIEEEKEQLAAVSLFRLNITIASMLLISTILLTLLPKEFPGLLGLVIIADLFLGVCILYALLQPLTRMAFESVKDVNIFVKMGLNLFERKRKVGDIVLCKNVDTKQNVIMPCKDRFLHMLVLGPTGSGKTSQIILPMLNQDMQNLEAGITVIEPKGDLAEKAYAMAQYYGRPAIYFNPILESCPKFNPLGGREEDVIENVVTTFNMLNPDSPQYFKDMNEQLLRNSLKVLKRLMGDEATLIDLSRLISNAMGEGRKMVTAFAKKRQENESLRKENDDIANYFLGDYFNEKSKTYENTSGIRSQVAKIVSNTYLRKVLNPKGRGDVNFDKHLENGGIICISTAQGSLRELGSFLGYFIILNFQSSVFKRPGNEDTRRHHFLYIDEFQTYSNPGFADMLTQGRSYRVASHLATQNRALIGMGSGRDGDDFIELVSTNARNVVIFPGGNFNDAKYYSDQFGEIDKRDVQIGVTRQKFNPIYFSGGKAPTEQERVMETTEARYSPTDIIYRKFGEITYMIIQDNTLQTPGVGKVEYIDKSLNQILNQMVSENNKMMSLGINPNLCRVFSENGRLKSNLNWAKIEKDYEEWDRRTHYGFQDDDNEDSVNSKKKENNTASTERTKEYTNNVQNNDSNIKDTVIKENSSSVSMTIKSNVSNQANKNNVDDDFILDEEIEIVDDVVIEDKTKKENKNSSSDNIDIEIDDDDDMI